MPKFIKKHFEKESKKSIKKIFGKPFQSSKINRFGQRPISNFDVRESLLAKSNDTKNRPFSFFDPDTFIEKTADAETVLSKPYIPYAYLPLRSRRLRTGRLGGLLASVNIDFKTRNSIKKKVFPDDYFTNSEYVCRKIINYLCKDGKKRRSYGIFNKLIVALRKRKIFSPRQYITKVILSLRPLVTLRKNMVSGVVKKVPSSINVQSSVSVALNWFILSARARSERTIVEKLVAECLDVFSKRKCGSKKKKIDHYKAVYANRYLIYKKHPAFNKKKRMVGENVSFS
jgi:small subunit ribosomal protein S7